MKIEKYLTQEDIEKCIRIYGRIFEELTEYTDSERKQTIMMMYLVQYIQDLENWATIKTLDIIRQDVTN